MNELMVVGDRRYKIRTQQRDGEWLAQAEDADSGNRFGVECSAPAEAAAVQKMGRWLEWQAEHAAALQALQTAERAFHRTLAGSAFVSPTEGPSALEMQKESLDKVEAARFRLDEVRSRQPQLDGSRT